MRPDSNATSDGRAVIARSLEEDEHPLRLLTPAIHARIRMMAYKQLGSNSTPTFDATEIAQITVEKMLRYENQRFENVRHFYGAIATQIRRIIIDHARKHRPETLNMDGEIPGRDGPLWRGNISELIAMVERLEPAFPDEMEAVNLLCFIGCTQEEAAVALGTTRSVVEKRFRRAKALLLAGLEA